jgi:hypothetical protein
MLTRKQFDSATAHLVPQFVAAISRLNNVPSKDWQRWFAEYHWKGDWHDGLMSRVTFSQRFATEGVTAELLDAILTWGGDRFDAFDLPPERIGRVATDIQALGTADQGGWIATAMTKRANPRDYKAVPMTTKFYHMYSPAEFVIYDQHVARALAALTAATPGWPSNFPFKMPDALARGYGENGLVAASNAFLTASWLARDVAARLNELGVPNPASSLSASQLGGSWLVCHVEMALFMLGKALDRN